MDANEPFIKIYDDFSDKIFRFIYYKTCHRETAEDIMSQTFLKAMEKWTLYNANKGTVSAWLYGIARNLIIDHYRKQQKWGYFKNICDIWDLPSDEDILRQLTEEEQKEELYKALNQLPSKQREIIMLRLWEDMPYREISEIMSRSESACKMLFSRSIGKLKLSMDSSLLFQLLISGINFSGGKNE